MSERERGLSDPEIVDVRVPTLGSSPYLVETIESVLAQTFTSWQLIISENGVGSESLAENLVMYLRDPRIQHVITGSTIPRGQHFTRLIHTGHARYVALLHDDDRWRPTFLEQRVEFLDANQQCGFVFGGARVIDAESHSLGRKRIPLAEGVYPSTTILPLLLQSNMVAGAAVLVRRTAYEAIDASYSEGLFSDHEMWLRLAANFDVGCLRTWDSDFRMHEAQASATRRTEFGRDQLQVLDVADDLPIPARIRRAERAKAYSQCALDALEQRERRQCIRHLARAMHIYPASVIRPKIAVRMFVALMCLPLGGLGRRLLARWRDRRRRLKGLDIEPPS